MAMSTILLFPGPVALTDGTSGNIGATSVLAKSSGTPPTNAPNLFFTELIFNGATDWHCFFGFAMPSDYASGGTLKLNWKRASGTGAANVVWKGAVAAVTPGGTEVPNTKVLSTVATVTTAAGTTSQALQTSSINLNMDSAAPADSILIMLGRDADNAADTLDNVDAQVPTVWFEYTVA